MPPDPPQGTGETLLEWAERALYWVAAAVLVVGGAVLLGAAAWDFVQELEDGVVTATTSLLGTLLLAFVFVELLGAVRSTLRERQLLAEPFLLVGIIAAIKEIVLVAGTEHPSSGGYEELRDAMIEVGVLGLLVLVLAVATFVLRRREREPAEGSS